MIIKIKCINLNDYYGKINYRNSSDYYEKKKKKFWTPGTVDLIGTKITRKRDESFTKVCKINI